MFKKVLGIFLIFLIALFFSSCKSKVDSSWLIRCNGSALSEGVYRYYLKESYERATELLAVAGESTDNLAQKKINNVAFNDWVKDDAMKSCRELLDLDQLFHEESLSFTEDELKEIAKGSSDVFKASADIFRKLSITDGDVRKAYSECKVKYKKLFDHYYSKSGKKAVDDSDLLDYYKKNYINYSMVTKYILTDLEDDSNVEGVESQKKETDKIRQHMADCVAGINSGKLDFSAVPNILSDEENSQEYPVCTETIDVKNSDVPEEILVKLKNLSVGKADFVELEDAFILIFKNDINSSLPDFSNIEVRENVLQSMKTDEFYDLLHNVENRFSIEINDGYLKTILPTEMFKNIL